MVMAKEIDRQETQKERKEKDENGLFRGQRISDGNNQRGQMDNLSSDFNPSDHLIYLLPLPFKSFLAFSPYPLILVP